MAGSVAVPPLNVTGWPTFRPSVLAVTLKVLIPAVSVVPAALAYPPTAPNNRRAAPAVVGLAESVTVVPLTDKTVELAASTPVDPAAVVTVMPG